MLLSVLQSVLQRATRELVPSEQRGSAALAKVRFIWFVLVATKYNVGPKLLLMS